MTNPKIKTQRFSVFDIFKIGVGPSSSHTMGPMLAANQFIHQLSKASDFESLTKIEIELYGSLAATGIGHFTDKAIMLGLSGEHPETIISETIETKLNTIKANKEIDLLKQKKVTFIPKQHIVFKPQKQFDFSANTMLFRATLKDKIIEELFYSVGGGQIIQESKKHLTQESKKKPPYVFTSGNELLRLCDNNELSISQLMMLNEQTWDQEESITKKLNHIWFEMKDCIRRGCHQTGYLPGFLKVKKRASQTYKKLQNMSKSPLDDSLVALDWVNLYALAVNEENACGAKIVTAPTNGAAGVIPAVLSYYENFCPIKTKDYVSDFLLTAGAIGLLYVNNASISGAEVGCQGEVGVACSMAAGALTAIQGGSTQQVEQAAEIAMEHNLGLTCDPVGGLVQIPCIERNAMAAVKAINASRLALTETGIHYVSLDSVIKTMWLTGKDMQQQYKETSTGGLALNVKQC